MKSAAKSVQNMYECEAGLYFDHCNSVVVVGVKNLLSP